MNCRGVQYIVGIVELYWSACERAVISVKSIQQKGMRSQWKEDYGNGQSGWLQIRRNQDMKSGLAYQPAPVSEA